MHHPRYSKIQNPWKCRNLGSQSWFITQKIPPSSRIRSNSFENNQVWRCMKSIPIPSCQIRLAQPSGLSGIHTWIAVGHGAYGHVELQGCYMLLVRSNGRVFFQLRAWHFHETASNYWTSGHLQTVLLPRTKPGFLHRTPKQPLDIPSQSTPGPKPPRRGELGLHDWAQACAKVRSKTAHLDICERRLLFSMRPKVGKWIEDPLPRFTLVSECLNTCRT